MSPLTKRLLENPDPQNNSRVPYDGPAPSVDVAGDDAIIVRHIRDILQNSRIGPGEMFEFDPQAWEALQKLGFDERYNISNTQFDPTALAKAEQWLKDEYERSSLSLGEFAYEDPEVEAALTRKGFSA